MYYFVTSYQIRAEAAEFKSLKFEERASLIITKRRQACQFLREPTLNGLKAVHQTDI